MVVERFGRFHGVLTAGVHFIVPVVDRPKHYSFRYRTRTATQKVAGGAGAGVDDTRPQGISVELVEGRHLSRIFSQDVVIDFPRQCAHGAGPLGVTHAGM